MKDARQSYTERVIEALTGRVDRLSDVAVYLVGRKEAQGWYGYWRKVRVENFYGKHSLKTELWLMESEPNGYGGWDVTGAAQESLAIVVSVLKTLCDEARVVEFETQDE